MALKSVFFLLFTFLILSSIKVSVSSQNEEHFMEGPYIKKAPGAPTNAPVQPPSTTVDLPGPSPGKAPLAPLPPAPSPLVKPPLAPLPPPQSPLVKPPLAPLLPPPPQSPLVKPPLAPLPPAPSTPPAYSPTHPPRTRLECIPPCLVRCKFHSRKKVCIRACLTCCERCKCVPPGQSGNHIKCGKCYANMKTRNGKFKCP